jgi:hypothetical protein
MVQSVESRYRKKFFATVLYSREAMDAEKTRKLGLFAAQLEAEAAIGMEPVLSRASEG